MQIYKLFSLLWHLRLGDLGTSSIFVKLSVNSRVLLVTELQDRYRNVNAASWVKRHQKCTLGRKKKIMADCFMSVYTYI